MGQEHSEVSALRALARGPSGGAAWAPAVALAVAQGHLGRAQLPLAPRRPPAPVPAFVVAVRTVQPIVVPGEMHVHRVDFLEQLPGGREGTRHVQRRNDERCKNTAFAQLHATP